MALVRIRFSKLGKIRWTSHRDVARMWERAFRRERLPLAYTGGFSPRPKVSFGLALSTGHESLAEYLDVHVEGSGEDLNISEWPQRLSAALPVGVDSMFALEIPDGVPSLQQEVTSSSWRLVAAPAGDSARVEVAEMDQRVAALLAAPEVVVTRSRKGIETTSDIRDGILSLRVLGPERGDAGEGVWLETELAAQPRSLRPSELLAALGSDVEERHVRRTNQWISRSGTRFEPLDVALGVATGAPRAMEHAS
ncbi:MAG: TIGR03936 family radical SAM-associated protein [Acidimicrobiales bacterium]